MEMPEIRQRKPDPGSPGAQTGPATDPAPDPRPNRIPPSSAQRDPNGQIPQTSWIRMAWIAILMLIIGVLLGCCRIPLFAFYSMPGANVTFFKMPAANTSPGWTLFSPALADGVLELGGRMWANRDQSTPRPNITAADWMNSVPFKMNVSVNPCEDFYHYACGRQISNINQEPTPTSDEKLSVNAFTDLNDLVQKQLISVLTEKIDVNETTPFKLPKHLYQLCMNIDKPSPKQQGVNPMQAYYWKLQGWPLLVGDDWNYDLYWRLHALICNLREAGFNTNHLFDISVRVDPGDPSIRIIYIDQPTLSINREYLTEGHPKLQTYLDYSVEMAVLLGADRERAKRELNDSVMFEMRLAKILRPNNERQNKSMSLREFLDEYPPMNWLIVFGGMFIDTDIEIDENEIIIVQHPQFVKDLTKLLNETWKSTAANYVMRRVVNFAATFVSKDLQRVQLKYSAELCDDQDREYPCLDIATESLPMSVERKYNRGHLRKYFPYVVGLSPFFFTEKAKLYGDSTITAQELEDHCLDVVAKSMPIAVGALYIRKYFNAPSRHAAQTMVNHIKNAFTESLTKADWMNETTKKSALEKFNSMVFHIGYPDELMDDKILNEYYKDLKFVPDGSYLSTVLTINRFATSKNFQKLSQGVNLTDWTTHSNQAGVDAFYNPTENSINFPASYFQGQLFSMSRHNHMNYGAMGTLIGREITRGFFDEGQYVGQRTRGQRLVKRTFGKHLQCLAEQYDNYIWDVTFQSSTWTLKMDGYKTLVENVADNGGIRLAYDAYQKWAAGKTGEPGLLVLGLTPQQMFWLTAAQTWYSVFRPDTPEKRNASVNCSIPPGQFRVLGSMSNLKAFSDDFHCPAGSPMNRTEKCKVW